MLVYLDNSATTKQYDEVTKVMVKFMEEDYGNPSSLHRMGFTAEKALKQARMQTFEYLKKLGTADGEIIFTSGGTESDNLAILGSTIARKRSGSKIITTEIEHPAILESFYKLEKMGFDVVYIPVSKEGIIDLDFLKSALDEETLLISVQAVNNEVGAIQPLNEIKKIRDEANDKFGKKILLHTDAVQAVDFRRQGGSLQRKLSFEGYDMISISGHKLHGPKGVGALYIKKGVRLESQICGGGQEKNLRSGTENMPAIVGLAKALEMKNPEEDYEKLKFALWQGLNDNIENIVLNGPRIEDASSHILNVSFLDVRGEVLLHTLEQEGIYVSTGSACSSNKKGQSHVLKAMKKSDKEIEGAIRFSFGAFNNLEEIDYTVSKVSVAVKKFRKLGSFR